MESFEVWSISIGMRRGPSALKLKVSWRVKRALKLLVRRQRADYTQVVRTHLVLMSARGYGTRMGSLTLSTVIRHGLPILGTSARFAFVEGKFAPM